MPNGKPGDHPLTDIFVHGLLPFPADIEKMIRKLWTVNPFMLRVTENQVQQWGVDGEFESARKGLCELIDHSKPTSA
jgi:hypothetical protein